MTAKSGRPESRAPRRSGRDVIKAALGILDRQGLSELTMRNLAESLGLQPSALYWHFPNKQTLLAAVADDIVARTRTAPATTLDWREQVRFDAAALRDALLAFKDGAEVVSSALALGLGAAEADRRLAAGIGRGGFDPAVAETSAEALLHFVIGQTWHEQQRLQADSLGVVAAGHTASAPADGPGSPSGDGAVPRAMLTFDVGVDLFLAGLEARAPVRAEA